VKSRDILEKINDATVTPGFYAEKPIMGGRYIIKARAKEIEGMSPALLVSVHDLKNPHRGSGFLEREGMGGIASFRFIARPDGYMYSSSSGVDPRYQRQGIATEVYRFVRSLGNSIKPSKLQTDQGRAMWQAWQQKGIMEATQGVQRGLGRFFQGQDPMAEYVPERGTHSYALHPDNWERTFYSLTLKDPHKIRFYRPRDIDLPSGTLVADMFWANRFHRAKTDAERQHAVKQYRRSMVPVDQADISKYRMPELLIPPGLAEERVPGNFKGKPRVYLDMDGVLADFFAEWARLALTVAAIATYRPPTWIPPWTKWWAQTSSCACPSLPLQMP
jgi:GNAT superfamily N-acetyltransferase